MLLTLQIAAGIVLAYVIIANGRAAVKILGYLGAGVVAVAVMVIAYWAASSAFTAASPKLWSILPRLGMMIGSLALLMFIIMGALGFLWILREFTRNPSALSKTALIVATLANSGVVLLSSYMLDFLPVGAWIKAGDEWSRANGYADGLIVAAFAIGCLWPYMILPIIRLVRGRLVQPPWQKIDESALGIRDVG